MPSEETELKEVPGQTERYRFRRWHLVVPGIVLAGGLAFVSWSLLRSAPPSSPPSPSSAPGPRVFPNENTTGVPSGTSLSSYAGPCAVTAPNTVIDAKRVDCTLVIRAQGVVVSRSEIQGTVAVEPFGSVIVRDTDIMVGQRMGTGIGDQNFTAQRVHVIGGNRSVNCWLDCTVEDSYVHGQFRDDSGRAHESGIRMGANGVIRGNTIACDAPDVPPDAGCSAALTGYGDFATVQNNLIDGNLFLAGSGGYCAFGGSTQGKPYSSEVNNIRFTNNFWERGTTGKCGQYGPITSFDSLAPGNVWSNNKWDDGTPVQPAN